LSSLAIVAIDLRSAERILTSMSVAFSSRAPWGPETQHLLCFKQHRDNACISYLNHMDIVHYEKHPQ